MPTRYIQVPDHIVIEDLDGSPLKDPNTGKVVEPARFPNFAFGTTFDVGLIATLDGLEAAHNIRLGIRGKQPFEFFELSEHDYELWVPFVKNPTTPLSTQYAPIVAGQLYPFIQRILSATAEKPAIFGVTAPLASAGTTRLAD